MRGTARYHRRGSVVIMAVGLLVMLGMIASTYVIVSYMDRKEATSIARAAPAKVVAQGALGRVLGLLKDDLYIDDNGTPGNPNDDILFGGADTPEKCIDYPDEDVDQHLARFEPEAGMWYQLSDIPGDTWPFPGVAPMPAVPFCMISDGRLVDTDGLAHQIPNDPSGTWYYGDSLLWDSGVSDRLGNRYHVAVRVIDASGLINVNTAYAPAAAPVDGTVMPITNVDLGRLINAPALAAVHTARLGPNAGDSISDYWQNYALRPHNIGPDGAARRYFPFDGADMFALAWGSNIPDVARGRLHTALGSAVFRAAQRYLTTHSVSRITVPPSRDSVGQKYKADLNKSAAYGRRPDGRQRHRLPGRR